MEFKWCETHRGRKTWGLRGRRGTLLPGVHRQPEEVCLWIGKIMYQSHLLDVCFLMPENWLAQGGAIFSERKVI